MWMQFNQAYNWSPPEKGGRVTIHYKEGHRYNVTRACADAALAAGVALEEKPKKQARTNEKAEGK